MKLNITKKSILIIAITAIVVVGVGVSATVLLNLNPKQQYFKAEKDSLEFITETVKERYSDEFEWAEQTKEKPSESEIELSAEYNDPSGFDSMGIQEAINSASISVTSGLDPEKKEMHLGISPSFAGVSIDDIEFYLSGEKVMASVPFFDKYLQVKENELGNLLSNLDPTYNGDEEFNFDAFFERELMSEEDREYFTERYLKFIYDELPKEYFTTEDESVEVDGQEVDATKITLTLSEEELKSLIEKVLTKMESDDRLKELLTQQSAFAPEAIASEQTALMEEEFETMIKDFKEGLKDLKIPNGLTSSLWVENDLIVKRDFKIELGPSDSELVTFTFAGTQLLSKESQNFNYQFGISDDAFENSVDLTGDFTWKDNVAEDTFTISADGMGFTYTGNENLADGTREFEREFSLADPAMGAFAVNWNGDTTYEEDSMNGEHQVSFAGEGISEDIFKLNLLTDSKLVKSIDGGMDSKEVVNLGEMSAEELDAFVNEDLTPQLQQWMAMFMGAGF